MTYQLEQLPGSLRQIAEAMQARKGLKPNEVRKIILEAQVQPEDLLPWADFDHPVQDSYGRKMAYHGEGFEIMVMSWRPGDYSAIHDHGHTQWGAVQIFGPAEHATFRVEDDRIFTLARWTVSPGDVIGVSHSLVHQMGNNTTDTPFLSLHVYGEPTGAKSITGDARVFELASGLIQRVDGGVFFALPPEGVKSTEPAPRPDFPTQLRHNLELLKRLRTMQEAGIPGSAEALQTTIADTFSPKHQPRLLRCLALNTDENGHQNNSTYWRVLLRELQEAAKVQRSLRAEGQSADHFYRYAQRYDALIGQPCLHDFMAGYLKHTIEEYVPDIAQRRVLSLGCGTGLVEQHIMATYGLPQQQLLGIDISEAMLHVAKERISTRQGDMLQLEGENGQWDVVYSGLNVFHYLHHSQLEAAIQRSADYLAEGGIFIGDFITPDHIRWYPNVMYSEAKDVISLRQPRLVEDEGRIFQESEITNIAFTDGQMDIEYAGVHRRFLPPLHRVRQYFERAFHGRIVLLDAHTLAPIPEWADSCPSTRYVVVAEKGA